MSLTRRTLLTRAALAGTAALALSRRSAHAAARGDAPGIQLYAVARALEADVSGTLRQLREIGFTQVEPAGLAGLSAAELRKRLDDADLVAPSVHLPFAESLDAAELERNFADAHALGARYVVSSMLRAGSGAPLYEPAAVNAAESQGSPPPPRAMTLDDARRTAEAANRIGERARRAGLQFAYHNHQFELAPQDGVVAFDELLRETDTALVKYELDCGWAVLGGADPAAYFEEHPGRFPLIHVKDFLPAPAEQRDEHGPRLGAELGRGTIDYGPIFAAANANGLEHFFAEQEEPFARMSQLDAARVAYEYLRRVNA